MSTPWFSFDEGTRAWTIRVYVQPGASRTETAGLFRDALKLRVAAPPVDGKANEAATRFLARRLQVAGSNVELVHGAGARMKTFRVRGTQCHPETLVEHP